MPRQTNKKETLNEYSQNAIASGDMDSTYYQQIQKLQKSIYTYLDPAQWENQVYQTPRSLLQKTGVFVMLFYTHSPIPAAKQKGELPL